MSEIAVRSMTQGVRYLAVGGLNTAIGYALFALCYLCLGSRIPYGAILVISHLLAVSIAFATHRQWVFGGLGALGWTGAVHGWLKFQLAYVGLLLLGLAVNAFLLTWVLTSHWLAQLGATGACAVAGYLVHSRYVFKPRG